MIEMRVGNKHMINHAEFGQAELAHPRTSIDQNIVVE
jgi:hypothetical protein